MSWAGLNGFLRSIRRIEALPSAWNSSQIIREELFGPERLEQHAASLAQAQTVTPQPPSRPSLHARLGENAALLLAAYRAIAKAAGEGIAITPAAEWLLDNYHLVEDQIRQIHDDLPPRFYRQLPKLASGPLCGYPRVFGLAWACVAHSDSRLEEEALRRFVRAYQVVQPLTIGELWAIAITLRIVLIENLRRAAERIVASRIGRKEADEIADRLLGVNGYAADPQALVRRDGEDVIYAPAFVVQLVKRLRDQDPRVMPALQWLEDKLVARSTSSEELVRDEHHRQGASNVTVRNIITSMRRLSDIDWPEFFESVSLVDETLRAESDFADMDFATRNLYRTVIEQIARKAKCDELQVARAVVAAVRAVPALDSDRRRKLDAGYHLLAQGRGALERTLGYRNRWARWRIRGGAAIGPEGYIGAVALTAAVILAAILVALPVAGLGGWPTLCLALLGAIPSMDAAVALVNRVAARAFGARILPGLALRNGVPSHLKTIVVVPTLLTTLESIDAQIEHLEVHFLASAHGHVHFALLSDWTDADTESAPGDIELLNAARAGIARLNRSHASADGERFYLFHRRRTWSETQRRWMGWERKRGKLHELNRLLRGATDTHFLAEEGVAQRIPEGVRYVVTLDADTRLPRETLRRLVGKIAHPLNQPRFDAGSGRVVEGYAVLQPRVTPSLPVGLEGSIFRRVFSSMNGIDAYDAAVSDVYQDLFAAGSYAGKGIYDVDAFEAALADRVPDGTLLSHDLFEGTFARAGLASDIEVVEAFPARYDVAAARSHRWARGDWQLLPWMFNRGKTARQSAGALPLIASWKMLDNLRRSLSAPLAVAALFAGWTLPLAQALLWTSFIVATIALPTLLPVIAAIVPRRRGVVARSHLRALRRDFALALAQSAFLVIFLAHQAWLMVDAIGRTLFRLTVSRRRLLQWVTSAQAEFGSRLRVGAMYRRMLASVALALLALIEVLWIGHAALVIALPFVALWLAAPAIATRISASPQVAGRVTVSAEDANALRLVARRTWRYFETFVTAADHMLPPDNFQEDPQPVLAHRTSPTNLGLYLLCVVTARDFGWIATTAAIERLEATLATMARLPRHRGHFYNWYDTRDLRPLDPCYVSSVDSGNLAAHLIAVANACREWCGTADAAAPAAGVSDALQLARIAFRALPATHVQTDGSRELGQALDAFDDALRAAGPSAFKSSLHVIVGHAMTLADCAHAFALERDDELWRDVAFWAHAACNSVESLRSDLQLGESALAARARRAAALERLTRDMAMAMEFDFLLEPTRQLLSIGYLATEGTLDPSCYDLLASEARLASFFAIAKRDVEARHWFRLGRAVTAIGSGAALISWSGSMFEYLMPSLVMRAPAGSLLEQTNRLIVRRQIEYGTALDVPWGVSESAYNARDLDFTYQYSNFGVPGLGLKRGLGENLVIAPYATGLAAMVDPYAAARNYEHLARRDARGRYGFYEALDFTRARLPEGQTVAIVRAYMAHHQGMTIVALANVLFDGRMRARFHDEPSMQAAELLLQERTPRDVSVAHPRAEEVLTAARNAGLSLPEVRRLRTPHDATPQTHLLSNGRYAVMMTAAGSGYSRRGDLAITRWREDTTCDDYGSYIFLRDEQSGSVWSAGYQPLGVDADQYEATFAEDRVEIVRADRATVTTLEVMVSPEDDAEVRRVSITNVASETLDIELTTFCELVLAVPAADVAHPAFSKLFVQTEYLAKLGALVATRRRRSSTEPEVWVAQHIVVEAGEVADEFEYETDRARFLGRGRDIHAPLAMLDGRPLSNTVGTVLDPVFALRRRMRILPGTTARLSLWTVVADTRAELFDLIDKHRSASAFARAATLAWTQGQVQLRHIGVTPEEANLFQRIAGHVLYADASLRPSSDAIQRAGADRSALWAQSISGDLPIVLLRIDQVEDAAAARQLLNAHEYWQLKRLAVDLVILNERGSSYVQDLQSTLETLVRMRPSRPRLDAGGAQGSIFVLRADLISPQTRATLSAVARVVFVAQRGSLEDQLERRVELSQVPAVPQERVAAMTAPTSIRAAADLEFSNGLGGFALDGRDYVMRLDAGQPTPAPWINVIANASFGFQVAAEGSGYTWSVNSRENQLTQWSNDPVSDRTGEALYVRDEETGELWGPTVAPVGERGAHYSVRHAQGFSRFEHEAHNIATDLTVFVPCADPIKICRLRLRNVSGRERRLSVTAYVEWVLGIQRGATAPFIVTEIDAQTGAMLARNPWNAAFGARVAFADLGGLQTTWTGDRREFLGRHGRLGRPAGLFRAAPLSGRVGAGLDPCCALQASIRLGAGESTEVTFLLGQTESVEEARALLLQYRSMNLDAALDEVKKSWDDVLETVQVETPDRSLDIMLNRWLLYQTLACRLWSRSAFYQASGAYGFRDQLQDGMALALARPELTREHLLRAAARQFAEGDVQHWWLPVSGAGVRTRISDDRIWLPYAAAHYLAVTGDTTLLDEPVPFIEGPRLGADEHDAYYTPQPAEMKATFFDHCTRALDGSLAVGAHGLPLIGTGDWNDGMNRVGEQGRGESVWLGWFLFATLSAFAPIASARADHERAARWLAHAAALRESLERDGWDGAWYRRGYYDDGAPLGSAMSEECRIDSIAQSWGTISGAADAERARRAMDAVDAQLIRRDARLALLFTPPFDRTALDPGYVKGYPPGIRENGGQYTHAAAWAILALTRLGQGDRAAELFALVNPINHTNTRAGLRRYKVEPYVVAADVYSCAPHVGRGGWTWYTGSAGWLYRAGLEGILGFRKEGERLLLDPCIPRNWRKFEIHFKHRSARYTICVENPDGVSRRIVRADADAVLRPGGIAEIPLRDDGASHRVLLTLG